MVDYLARPVVHEAFFKKYASKKFLKGMFVLTFHINLLLMFNLASILARQWAKKNAVLFGITDIDLALDQIS
jgi:G2/mitotic-specific cyclin 1/2